MDPHCFDADPEPDPDPAQNLDADSEPDPDPAQNLDADSELDPDPAQNLDADPDPDPDQGGGVRSAKNVHPPWQNPRYAPVMYVCPSFPLFYMTCSRSNAIVYCVQTPNS